jgi:hypothetical protein
VVAPDLVGCFVALFFQPVFFVRLYFQLQCGGWIMDNFTGNGVCRPAWENRLTVSALMTPTNKPTFAGAS